MQSNLIPYLIVPGAARLLDFLKQAFDAEEQIRVPAANGGILHAAIQAGDSIVEVADETEQHAASPTALHLYVSDVDSTYRKALEAGAASQYAPIDQAYGDREAAVRDPTGNFWCVATRGSGGPVPNGLHSVTPFLFTRGADRFIAFLQLAFGAEAVACVIGEDGAVRHCQMRLGNAMLELSEARGEYQPMPAVLHFYVPDADAAYHAAMTAGATSLSEPADMPYGERSGAVRDAWDNRWYLATKFVAS